MNHPIHTLSRRRLLAALGALAAGPALSAPTFLDHGPAPAFSGIAQWLNSPPLTVAGLRGQVVLLDFWTYGCINCLRTLPHVNRWASTYGGQGLAVVGIHTPEFPFERSTRGLQVAMQRHGVKHAVAQDNAYATWSAYGVQYWPSRYLIDRRGRIVMRQFGEGGYGQMEEAIRALLAAPP